MQEAVCLWQWVNERAAHESQESAPRSPAILLAQVAHGSGGAFTAGTYNGQLLLSSLHSPNKTLLAWPGH